MSKRKFQTEVSQLLQLIVHSLYSHPEIFLRELISNSSDALDKLRHLTLTEDVYKALPFNPRVDLDLNEEDSTLTIADTGIGMNEEDLVSHLGTIARSGTKNFLAQLSGDAKGIRISSASSGWASTAPSWSPTVSRSSPARPVKTRPGTG
jgi:molecular chaperone HtpG